MSNETNKMPVKNNLRVLMAQHKMSIKDVHEKTGLSRTTISKLYNESSNTIAFETIATLCKLFNVNIDEFLVINEDYQPPSKEKEQSDKESSK